MEKSQWKFRLLFMLTWNVYLKKWTLAIIFLKNHQQLREMYEHTPFGYSLLTYCSFNITKNKLDCYRDKDPVKWFCKDLKENVTEIPQSDEENKSFKKQ